MNRRMGEGGEGDAGIKETFCALKSGVIQKECELHPERQ